MINIYCLVDPRNNKPFYVGATNQQLITRLSGHIGELKTIMHKYWSDKHKLIAEIKSEGFKPRIRLLITCDIHSVNHYEYFFYTMLKMQGFTLLQKSFAFFYKEKHISEINFQFRNQSVTSNIQLYTKNSFGNK